ncbi:MAG TPA: ribosome biogenesis GTPase YlqF [Erysipelothrix sp.]|nr:ribosome biogenesis GTPase YlqF [Erysipelothrix sp.]
MSVQWFPGHMTKAIRQIQSRIQEVDMIIECRDARIPFSSSNPVIDEIIGNKPRLIVLTKRDLALNNITDDWVSNFNDQVEVLNVHKDNVKRKILNGCLRAMKPKHDRDLRRGIKPRMIRAMILGVPNVGKSTLMNRLANKKVADVSNRPGVTRALKKVKVSDQLEVIDSPGLLWPRFEQVEIGYHLALCLSVKESGYQIDDVVKYGINHLVPYYENLIKERYQVTDLNDFENLFNKAASLRGQPLDRGAFIVLTDIQNHVFGPMSWETYDFVRTTFLEKE